VPRFEAADAAADASELPVHLIGGHSVGEIADPQDRGTALALSAKFDLHPALDPQNLITVVGVRDQLDDRVVYVPDGQPGILHDAARLDFQGSSLDGGHFFKARVSETVTGDH